MTDFAPQRAALADVVAIPVTPFAENDQLDQESYRALIRRLLASGVQALTPNGNTSEFYALTPEERRIEVELTLAEVAAAGSEAQILVGVGQDVPSAVASALEARAAGARMVMVHQPVHPYVSLDGWVDYHRAIAEAVPDLGVVPYLRNPAIDGAAIARLGAACPNVIGVKYAVPDVVRFASVARDAGLDRFVWVAGLAELWAPSYFASGATGFTSGLVNVAPEVSLAMRDALRAGDYPAAMRVWELIRPFEELRAERQSANNVTVVKEALAALGLCRRDIRPPSTVLPPAERERVATMVKGWELP
ncbi:dihydrodipicolinate synthase family protein [Streptomyces sp. 3MP-14]|uniref:Dihydrodipicolinate synthase family protein n=1 Tax=Streptomyces mimosae TaxID=2586635 RepID=A0A5N6AL80_9ACTN|nr:MULTISPECIES: dihydrodipicolinate synthase family protein [Streptomyces]KAB8168826.1 dihydrodipicolinate synthase family protein [Streptomyces mimosae]KAB8177894.1 dihydrodipicolinate synthase family protein [Streptomyces sp. 3MP-14]